MIKTTIIIMTSLLCIDNLNAAGCKPNKYRCTYNLPDGTKKQYDDKVDYTSDAKKQDGWISSLKKFGHCRPCNNACGNGYNKLYKKCVTTAQKDYDDSILDFFAKGGKKAKDLQWEFKKVDKKNIIFSNGGIKYSKNAQMWENVKNHKK